MTEFDEESYLDSLLESIGDVEDIVSTKKIGVEKMLEEMNQEPEPEPEPEPELEPEPVSVSEPESEPVRESEIRVKQEVEESQPVIDPSMEPFSTEEINALLSNNSGESDMVPDFGEPELSESDLQRLADMDLDDIISRAKSDSVSIDELFDESDESLDFDDNISFISDDVHDADKNISSSIDNSVTDVSSSNVSIDRKAVNKLKKKEKKNGLLAVLKNIFFEDQDSDFDELSGLDDISKEDSYKKKKADKKKEKESSPKSKSNKKEKKKSEKTDKSKAVKKDIEDNTSQEPAVEEKPVDENQKLIEEVFGDKDTLDENIAPKKGLIAKIKYRLQQFKAKNAEEERLEEEAEERDIEEKKKQKEEKKAELAAKKEEAKKEKEAKPKKEKKPKPKKEKVKKEKKPKPEPKPGDILKIKPKSLLMFILLIAGICVLITVFNSVLTSSGASSRARAYYESGNYNKAYQELVGQNINKADKSIYEKSSVVMYVQRQYESFTNYLELNMYTEAINALVKGLDRYDTYYRQAQELGITEELDEQKKNIYDAFLSSFNISQADADKLLEESRQDFTQYYVKIDKMGKAMK